MKTHKPYGFLGARNLVSYSDFFLVSPPKCIHVLRTCNDSKPG